jgi:hypothetical protein
MLQQMALDFTGFTARSKRPTPALSDESADAQAVVRYLVSHCVGPSNARTAAQIGIALNWTVSDPGRKVRRLISAHKDLLPVVVCGDPGRGFYVPETVDQVTAYDRMLYAQLKSVACNLSAHRRLASRLGYQRSGSGHLVTYQRPAGALPLHKTPNPSPALEHQAFDAVSTPIPDPCT